MAGQLRYLPRREARENVASQRLALAPQSGNLFADIQLRVIAYELQLVDLCLEFRDRLFKIKKLQIHPTDHTLKAGTVTSQRLSAR